MLSASNSTYSGAVQLLDKLFATALPGDLPMLIDYLFLWHGMLHATTAG